VPYERQLAEKAARLRALLEGALGHATPLPPLAVFPSSPYEYRSRLELHRLPPAPPEPRRVKKLAVTKQSAPRAGFCAKRSGELVPVDDCPVACAALRAALREGRLGAPVHKDRWAVFAKDGELFCEGGRARGKIRLLDKTLTIDAGVFFQSNLGLLEALLGEFAAVMRRLPPEGAAWDLYCGVGVFALFLREHFPRLVLMEADKTALALARENLGVWGETNAAFYAASDAAWGRRMCARAGLERPAFVCADPPREGLAPDLLRCILENPPRLFAYISCNPRSLARDCAELCAGGFVPQSFSFYDFYPQTAHIESLVVFSSP
jgi:23S rRNA (uracil1939-C5)-methyltransferase